MIPPAQRVSSRFVLPSQPEHRSITSDSDALIKLITDLILRKEHRIVYSDPSDLIIAFDPLLSDCYFFPSDIFFS